MVIHGEPACADPLPQRIALLLVDADETFETAFAR